MLEAEIHRLLLNNAAKEKQKKNNKKTETKQSKEINTDT